MVVVGCMVVADFRMAAPALDIPGQVIDQEVAAAVDCSLAVDSRNWATDIQAPETGPAAEDSQVVKNSDTAGRRRQLVRRRVWTPKA